MHPVRQICIGTGLVLLDQISKYYVRNFTDLKIIENRSLPFGIDLGSGFLNLTVIVIALASFVWLFPLTRPATTLSRSGRGIGGEGLGFILIVGGATANIIDRIHHGRVVDFINIGISTLNLADLAIMGGIALLLMSNAKAQMSKS